MGVGSRTPCRAAEDPRSYPIGPKSLVHSSSGVTWHRDQDHGRRLWHGACVDSQALTQRLGEARSIFATNYAYQPAQWFLARVGPARASQSTQLGNYRGTEYWHGNLTKVRAPKWIPKLAAEWRGQDDGASHPGFGAEPLRFLSSFHEPDKSSGLSTTSPRNCAVCDEPMQIRAAQACGT
jgi:hypothetical protein